MFSVLLAWSDLQGIGWGKLDLSPFGEGDALCHFWRKPHGGWRDAGQELKLQTGDLSDRGHGQKGSAALQGAVSLPALAADVKLTNRIPEWKHGALKTHQKLKPSRNMEGSWRSLNSTLLELEAVPGKGQQLEDGLVADVPSHLFHRFKLPQAEKEG